VQTHEDVHEIVPVGGRSMKRLTGNQASVASSRLAVPTKTNKETSIISHVLETTTEHQQRTPVHPASGQRSPWLFLISDIGPQLTPDVAVEKTQDIFSNFQFSPFFGNFSNCEFYITGSSDFMKRQ
jgi:hypothetical protein